MKERILKREIILHQSIEEVFQFFSKAENLNTITPPDLNFEIVNSGGKEINEGMLIDYRIKMFGIKMKWRTLISAFKPPHYFVDEQLEGPYRKWVHLHTFRRIDKNKTLMTDEVRYIVPGLFLEPIIHKFIVRPKLEDIFDYRTKVCQDLFNLEQNKKF